MLPLDGVKVMDLSHAAAGPCCTMLLADMGADVMKIEPIGGESFRYVMNGAFLMNLNRNKRGMALNLNSDEGKDIALRLVEQVDVFVESFTPGTIDKLGLDYDTVSQVNPMIIYCSISGFGQTGPYRSRPSFDPIAQAMSGIMLATGEADRPPVRITPPTIDYGTGMLGAYGVALALMEREKTGKGKRMDVALFDTAIFYMGHYIANYSLTGQIPTRMGSGASAVAPYQVFQAKDRLVFIGVLTDEAWKKFCQSLGLDDLVADPRYATRDERSENRDELASTLNQIFEQYDSEELLAKLVANDIPCGPLLDVGEVIEDEQVIARKIIVDADYPGVEKVKMVRTPINYSNMNDQVNFRAPLLGEHTSEVLKELGYSDMEISQFAGKGVILKNEM